MAQLIIDTQDTTVVDAIAELSGLISARYPEARFSVELGEDPAGTYVLATVDADDLDEVMDVYIDRLIDLQIDHGLRLHVIPLLSGKG
jgi:hypothetical protein